MDDWGDWGGCIVAIFFIVVVLFIIYVIAMVASILAMVAGGAGALWGGGTAIVNYGKSFKENMIDSNATAA